MKKGVHQLRVNPDSELEKEKEIEKRHEEVDRGEKKECVVKCSYI